MDIAPRGHCKPALALPSLLPLAAPAGAFVSFAIGNGSPLTCGKRYTMSTTAQRFRLLSRPTYLICTRSPTPQISWWSWHRYFFSCRTIFWYFGCGNKRSTATATCSVINHKQQRCKDVSQSRGDAASHYAPTTKRPRPRPAPRPRQRLRFL